MKHAGHQALSELAPLLAEIRQLPGLQERKPGIFYRRSQAFLHFHEDPAGLFADAKLGAPTFERMAVNTPQQRDELLRRLREALDT
jgi:hypothetical protein